MIEDVLKFTNIVIDEIYQPYNKISSPIVLYKLHLNLYLIIYYIDLVANHYLALDFSEDFLQNSSYGKPEDKWRIVLNKDLEELNEAIKKYLFNIMAVSFENDISFWWKKSVNLKYYCGAIDSKYNVGYIENNSFILKVTYLDSEFEKFLKMHVLDSKRLYVTKQKEINLNTFEQRVALQKDLNSKNKKLKVFFQKLTDFIRKNFALEDMLLKI